MFFAGLGINTPGRLGSPVKWWWGNKYTAASADRADVLSAYNLCSAGDTLAVPSGSATWGSPITINKKLMVMGGGIGNTTLTAGWSGSTDGFFNYTPSADDAFDISGFTFESEWTNCGLYVGSSLRTPLTALRIHGCRFHKSLTSVYTTGEIYGCIDSNQFYEVAIAVRAFGNMGSPWYNWIDLPQTVGASSNLFIEDNTFEGVNGQANTAFIIEGGLGGRYCFRHNAITNWRDYDVFDSHGNQDPVTAPYSPGGSRGTMVTEIYENTFAAGRSGRFLYSRGGKYIVYNNTITGGYSLTINLTDEDGPTRFNYVASYPGYDIITASYFWNNSGITPQLQDPVNDAAYVQSGRDYFTSDPGYTPYTYPHPLRG
jgi:hypothetical protein